MISASTLSKANNRWRNDCCCHCIYDFQGKNLRAESITLTTLYAENPVGGLSKLNSQHRNLLSRKAKNFSVQIKAFV